MRIQRSATKRARIEIIPMIDTMFFLLVFFMIATLSMTLQQGLPVNLPESKTSTDTVDEVLTITVTEEGNLFVNKLQTSVEALAEQLQSALVNGATPSVVINADKAVRHGLVITVMDTVRRAGVTQMAIATQPDAS